jgi:NADPH2:quinone reductase
MEVLMKAVRVHQFGGPEVMRVEEVADPRPGPHQVVVNIKAAGVNPVDSYIRTGTYARKPALPYTPGSDAAGIVESTGNEVRGFRPGDRVYIGGTLTGAYAEKALSEEAQVHPLPERASFEQGAGVNVPYATAYRALFQFGQAKAGEIVLVHGASGGVGIAGVQLARSAGLKVIGTAGSDRGRALVRDQGAHDVINHNAPDFVDQALAATGGRGPDIILEMLANVNLAKDLQVVALHGRILIIGNRGTIEINPRDVMAKEALVQGVLLFNVTPEDVLHIHAGLYAGLENGCLRPIIGQELPLAEAPRAHEAVMAGGAYGKIVLKP